MDQTDDHTLLVKKGTKPGAKEMDSLLARMESAGVLKKLWAKYGIDTKRTTHRSPRIFEELSNAW